MTDLKNINSDNGAVLAGFTEEYFADSDFHNLHLSIRPDSDLDGIVTAFDHDEQEMIAVNAWLFSWEKIEA